MSTTTLRNEREHDTLAPMTTFTGPTIPDNLPLHTPVVDELSRRVNLGGYDTPIVIDARTSFEPRHHVSVDIGTAKEWTGDGDDRIDVVSKVEITVYGAMTFKDRTDSAAAVHVTRTRNYVGSYTKATAWDGRKFVEMPEGARKKVTAAIVELLGDIDWEALAAETQANDRARSINRHLSEARGSLEDARREMVRLAQPLLELSGNGVVKSV